MLVEQNIKGGFLMIRSSKHILKYQTNSKNNELNQLFIKSKDKKPDYEFYKKMSRAKIYFLDY